MINCIPDHNQGPRRLRPDREWSGAAATAMWNIRSVAGYGTLGSFEIPTGCHMVNVDVRAHKDGTHAPGGLLSQLKA